MATARCLAAPGYCSVLNGRGITNDDQRQLMLGMPKPASDEKCPPELIDTGPRGDVESVRELLGGPLVPSRSGFRELCSTGRRMAVATMTRAMGAVSFDGKGMGGAL